MKKRMKVWMFEIGQKDIDSGDLLIEQNEYYDQWNLDSWDHIRMNIKKKQVEECERKKRRNIR